MLSTLLVDQVPESTRVILNISSYYTYCRLYGIELV